MAPANAARIVSAAQESQFGVPAAKHPPAVVAQHKVSIAHSRQGTECAPDARYVRW